MAKCILQLALWVTFLSLPSSGLQLYFSQRNEVADESCGELYCSHNIIKDGYNRSITSLSLSRQVNLTDQNLLASLNSSFTTVRTRKENLIIVGSLSSSRAYFNADLLKDGSCKSEEFFCQVVTTDAFGNNEVFSSLVGSLVIEKVKTTSFNSSFLNSLSQDILERINNLEMKLENNSKRMEAQINDKLNRIETKMIQMDHEISGGVNITQKVLSHSQNIESLTGQLLRRVPVIDTKGAAVDSINMAWNVLFKLNNQNSSSEQISITTDDGDAQISTGVNDTTLTMPTSCDRGMAHRQDIVQVTEPFVIPGQTGGFSVLCDGQTDGGGWIIIQRREQGSTDFFRDWDQYKKGFGGFKNDFWLGNEKISQLTNVENFATYELRVDLQYEDKDKYAHYSNFRMDSEENKYKLYVNAYSGTAGDGMADLDGQPFSTKDEDFAQYRYDCGLKLESGWWCYNDRGWAKSNINGRWGQTRGNFWYPLSSFNPVTYSQMMIRKLQ